MIMLAEPRSCSSFFMGQFERSPMLQVCGNYHYELLNPQNRNNTRKFLGMEPLDNPHTWKHDIDYTKEFFRRHRHGAFKVIVQGHGKAYIDYLRELKNVEFVSIRRLDEASSMASMLSRALAFRKNESAWERPARETPVSFADVIQTFSHNRSHNRYIDMVYWSGIYKTKQIIESFPNIHHVHTEDFRKLYHHELEHTFRVSFDFSRYIRPSHYSEIFTDWKFYEETVRDALGDIPGLG